MKVKDALAILEEMPPEAELALLNKECAVEIVIPIKRIQYESTGSFNKMFDFPEDTEVVILDIEEG
jgi:hypothetical protein